MENQNTNANSDFSVSAAKLEVISGLSDTPETQVDELFQLESQSESVCDEDFKAETEFFLPEPSLYGDVEEEEDEFLNDWGSDLENQDVKYTEDSWGLTSECEDEKYERKLSEESSDETSYDLYKENNATSWVDIKHMIVKNRSASVDSSWEIVSFKSADAVSLCSVNNLAKSVIEEFEMNCNFTENVVNRTSEMKKASSPMNVTDALISRETSIIQCGLILFRKDGAEFACVTKDNALMNPYENLTLPFVSPTEWESPLEAAVRGFIEQTNCHNLDSVAILNKVLQIPKGNSLLLLFPALISRELNFGPSENAFSWNNTYELTRQSRKNIHKQNLKNVIHAAYQLLLQHHDELPQLMDDDVAELLDVATYQLFEHVQKEGNGITIHEIKNFFKCNHDDLEKILQDCSEIEKRAMVKKLIAQLPINSDQNGFPILDQYGVQYHHVTALGQLEQILLQNFGENGLDWINIELDLRTCPCIHDEIVQDVLEQAGWSVLVQRFKFHLKKDGKIRAQAFAEQVLFSAINELQQTTSASIF